MLVPVKDAYEFQQLIPTRELVVYADTGTSPMLEVPERFNADVRGVPRALTASGAARSAWSRQPPGAVGVAGS